MAEVLRSFKREQRPPCRSRFRKVFFSLASGREGETAGGIAAVGGAVALVAIKRGSGTVGAEVKAHCAGEEPFEHVALRGIRFVNAEAAPSALRESLETIAESRVRSLIQRSRRCTAPVEGGFAHGRAQNGAVGFDTQRRYHSIVVVHQKMPRQVDHRQATRSPDPGLWIDIAGDGYGNAVTACRFCSARHPS